MFTVWLLRKLHQLVPGKYNSIRQTMKRILLRGYSAVSWNPSADENSINVTEGDVEITQEGDIYTGNI